MQSDFKQELTFADACEINPKKNGGTDPSTPVSFVPMQSVSNNGQLLEHETRPYSEVSKGFTNFIDNDVILAKITPCFENGKGALVRGLRSGIGFGSTEFHVLRARAGFCPEYIHYLVNTHLFRSLGAANLQGSAGHRRVPTDFIRGFKHFWPSLEDQRKIAACLSTWDKAIDAYDRLIALKEQQKGGLMQSLFSEVDHTRAFSNILDVIIGGTPSRSNDQYWDKERQTENRWISIANMKSSVISDSTEYISEQGVNNSNVKLLETGTVIFSFKLSLGKKAILGKPCYTNEAIAGLVVKDEKTLNRDYLYHALSVVDIDKEIDQAVKGKTLNKAKLNRLRLPWCPVVNQVRIANILNGADNEIKALVKKRDLLKKQKQGLMQQLLA